MTRLLAHVHLCPPDHNAGAEWYLLTALRYLNEHGFDCTLAVRRSTVSEYRGVRIIDHRNIAEEWAETDIGITHLDETRHAVVHSTRRRVPLVHLVHNQNTLRFHNVKNRPGVFVVFNSDWVKQITKWPGKSIVVHPPVVASDYLTKPGDSLTLLNLNAEKGGLLFADLARRMPSRPFLGVRGVYGKQVTPAIRNLRLLDNTPDAKGIYSQTRVLLMPSAYESWGRVAVEAAASGIPTICHPTPGLLESLGSAGVYAHRDHPSQWVDAIRRLDDPDEYERCAALARKRSAELDPAPELEALAAKLQSLVEISKRRRYPGRARVRA